MPITFNVLAPIVSFLQLAIAAIDGKVHGYGWTMVALAVIVKAVFWRLNAGSAKAMMRTQRLAPKVKALQLQYRDAPEKIARATAALYKAEGVNPLAGCLPQLVQLPVLIGLYSAITADKALFATQCWLWIGSPISALAPRHLLAANLAAPDALLLGLYMISMYFSIRSSAVAVDVQSAQQQQLLAFVSPVITGYLGLRYAWPSALLIYWLTSNVIAILQQRYVFAKHAAYTTSSVRSGSIRQWMASLKAYALFFAGRAFPSRVDIFKARWIAWSALSLFVFGFAIVYAANAVPSAAATVSNLALIGLSMTALLYALLKGIRGSVAGF